MYNLLARGIEQEYLPFCGQFGVSTIVYNPLAGGMLTGKQHRDRPLSGTRFDSNQMYLDRYLAPGLFRRRGASWAKRPGKRGGRWSSSRSAGCCTTPPRIA